MREQGTRPPVRSVVRPDSEASADAGRGAVSEDPAAGLRRGRWQLADTWIPFPAERLPAGKEGTGRLVSVRVESPWRAHLSDGRTPGSRGPGRLVVTDLAGEVLLRAGYLRVTVYASAFAVLSIGALASVLIIGGLRFFLGVPTVGTAIVGLVLAAMGGWLLEQLPRVGREVAEDAAHVLGVMLRAEGTTGFHRVHR